jgi:two-component system, NarL family, response regulator DevR
VAIRVVLAEPSRSHQVMLKAALSAEQDLLVVGCCDNAPSALLQVARLDAHVVLVTRRFTASLVDLCMRLQALDRSPRILVLDDVADEERLLDAIEAGVDGYVHGLVSAADGIRALSRGESIIPPAMLGPLLRRLIEQRREASRVAEQMVQLTPREREVLSLLVAGRDQAAISESLFISPDTARTHIQRIMRKLGVQSRAEVIAMVSDAGLSDRLERMVERSAS